jgi:outer membrane protein OmpA-like peptidoglycan-associated protein
MHVAASVRELRKSGAVTCEQHAGTVRLALTRQGMRQLRKPDLQPRLGKSWVFGAAGTAALAVGCASIKPDVPRVPLMGYPTPVGMQQVRAEDGQLFFAPCNPCAAPSPKTPVLSGHHKKSTADQEPAVLGRSGVAATNFEPLQRPPTAKTPALTGLEVPGPTPSRTTAGLLAANVASEPALTVHFRSGQATLTSEGKKAVAEIARKAKTAARVNVRGATDAQGSARVNEVLAKARAAAVQAELVANGVPAEKITTSYCRSCYVAPNDTAAGRQANRRAEIGFFELPTAPQLRA